MIDDVEVVVETESFQEMIGRLAQPPEFKATSRSGRPTCKLQIMIKCEGLQACNKIPAHWDWHAFDAMAKDCAALREGQWVYIAGRVAANKWYINVEDGSSLTDPTLPHRLSIHGVIWRIASMESRHTLANVRAGKAKDIHWLGKAPKSDGGKNESEVPGLDLDSSAVGTRSLVDSFIHS